MEFLYRFPLLGYLQLELPLLMTVTGILLPIIAALISYLCIVGFRRLSAFRKRKSSTLDFSGIPPLPDFELANAIPHPYRPWRSGKYTMTMGIRKMPEEDWLVLDNLYESEQELRRHLLDTDRDGVMQCLPGAKEACEEALECIVKFLTTRYPSQFQCPNGKPGYIHNAITKRTFKIAAPYEQHPLEVAAQLAMEDINLLVEGGNGDQEYYLKASFSMAPAGWYIQERIGWPLWKIHGPVPMWDEKLRKAMEKFFIGLKVENPVQRNNFFVQVDDTMFQQDPFANSLPEPPKIEDIRIRHERQTLRRLPRTRAVMFLVRTYLLPVIDLQREKEHLYAFRSAVNAWPAEMAQYKGRHVWKDVFEEWCEEMLGQECEGRTLNGDAV